MRNPALPLLVPPDGQSAHWTVSCERLAELLDHAGPILPPDRDGRPGRVPHGAEPAASRRMPAA
ncbi:hypothetical protein, partial [Streptomyces canarius]